MPSPARWRRLLMTGIAFLVTVSFIAGEHYWDRSQGRKEYERALARYDASGAPASPAGVKPPPPERNGVDLYLKALSLDRANYGKEQPESEEPSKILEIDQTPSDEEWKEIDDRIRKAAPSLALFIEAASSSEVVYPLHYEDGWAMQMPHINSLLEAANRMTWDLRLRRRAGTSEGTWERIDAIFGMADSLAAEPLMVSQLVRLKLMDIGLTSLEEALGAAAPPAEWGKRLERRLDPDRLREGMRRCSLYELAMGRETITRFLRNEPTLTQLDHDLTGLTKWHNMPEFFEEGARSLDRLVRIRAALDLPAGPAILNAEAVEQEFRKDPTFLCFVLAAYPRSWRRVAAISARAVLAREAVRIRAPVATLTSAPNAVADLAKDPLFGRPLTYLRTKEGFALEVSATLDELQSPWELQERPRWRCPLPSK